MSGLYVDEKVGVPFMATVLLFSIFLFLTPARFWFHVDRLDVRDAATWQEITVDYARTIERAFVGDWRATVRRKVDGGWEVVCATEWQPNDYDPDAVLPEPVKLEWLFHANPSCYSLPPGTYEATVTWRINPGSLFFSREVRRRDSFIIYGAP